MRGLTPPGLEGNRAEGRPKGDAYRRVTRFYSKGSIAEFRTR